MGWDSKTLTIQAALQTLALISFFSKGMQVVVDGINDEVLPSWCKGTHLHIDKMETLWAAQVKQSEQDEDTQINDYIVVALNEELS